MPFLLPPLRSGDGGRASLHLPSERDRCAPHFGVRPATLDPAVDVEAARARCLRPAGQAHVVENVLRHQRHLAHLRPGDPGHGVEVDAKLVRVVEVVGSDGMRVEVDAPEVDHPGQLSSVRDH